MPIELSPCGHELQKLTNKFYKHFKTNVSCHRHDQTFCALNDEREIVAAVMFRVIATTNEYLLRSLFTAPNYRHQGIAKGLCRLALDTHNARCFTLCEPSLVVFYQSLGFVISTVQFDSPSINKQIQKGLLLLERRPN